MDILIVIDFHYKLMQITRMLKFIFSLTVTYFVKYWITIVYNALSISIIGSLQIDYTADI